MSPILLSQEILISEFMANPNDGDNEWIELYNSGVEEVDLAGFNLSDDSTNLAKWTFPTDSRSYTLMPAKSYLIVNCGSPHFNHLSTNFKLSWRGEAIILSKNGRIIDQFTFGHQFTAMSCGKRQDKSSFSYFGDPSPGSPNSISKFIYGSVAPTPESNLVSGHSIKNQKVAFKVNGVYSKIFYSIDGSIPTDSTAILYKQPFSINKSTVVRARTYAIGRVPSPVVTLHLLIREKRTLPIVSFSSGKWNEYNSKADNSTDIDRAGHFCYFDEKQNVQFESNMAFSLAGVGSRSHPQKSISLHCKPQFYSEPNISYPIFPNKSTFKAEGFVLRNAGNAVPKTQFKDAFSHELVSTNMAVDYLDSRAVVVFVNGTYWGIYNLREKKCRHYYEDNHDIDSDSLSVVEGLDFSTIIGDGKEARALFQFVKDHDLRVPSNYDLVKNEIDLDNFIDYQIAEIYCGNTDWPINNLRMWRAGKGTKWRWLFYDTDHGFRANKASLNSIEYAMGVNNFHSEEYDTLLLDGTVLLRKLLENSEFKNRFTNRFAELLNSNFETDSVLKKLQEKEAAITEEINLHIERWGFEEGVRIKSKEDWLRSVEDMKSFARLRPVFLKNFLIQTLDLSGTFKLCVSTDTLGTILLNGKELLAQKYEADWFAGIELPLSAIPAEGYQFLRWEGYPKRESQIKLVGNAGQEVQLKAIFIKK